MWSRPTKKCSNQGNGEQNIQTQYSYDWSELLVVCLQQHFKSPPPPSKFPSDRCRSATCEQPSARSRGAPLRCVRACVVHYMGVADGMLTYIGTIEGFQRQRAGGRVKAVISDCPDQIGTVGRYASVCNVEVQWFIPKLTLLIFPPHKPNTVVKHKCSHDTFSKQMRQVVHRCCPLLDIEL